MRHRLRVMSGIIAALALAMGRAAFGADTVSYGDKGAEVGSVEAVWHDHARNVDVPVKVYFPKDVAAETKKLPVIVFSHGLGGSREGYELWSSQWASHGYVVVNPTHVGSDRSVLAGGIEALDQAANLENAVRRCADVSFVLDMMEKVNAGTAEDAGLKPLTGKLDLDEIGMAGHSFGAVTTMMIAGQSSDASGAVRPFGDKRVKAAIAMSPQPAMRGSQDGAFGRITIPVFFITGTEDDSPIGDVKAADRRVPFDHTRSPGTMLLTLDRAVHMSFAPDAAGEVRGQRLRIRQTNEPANQTAVKAGTTAFWDAHLKGDAKALDWLKKDYPGTVKNGKVEER